MSEARMFLKGSCEIGKYFQVNVVSLQVESKMHLPHIFPENKLAENIPSNFVFTDTEFPFPSYLSVLSRSLSLNALQQ